MSYVRHIWSSMSSHDFLQMFSSFLFLMIHLLRYIVLGNIYIYLYIIFHWSCWELAFYKITVSAPVPVPFLSSLSYFILTTILGILRIHVCRNECWMLKLKLCVEFRHLTSVSEWERAVWTGCVQCPSTPEISTTQAVCQYQREQDPIQSIDRNVEDFILGLFEERSP